MKVILQNNNKDCLLACYAMVLDYFGSKIPIHKLYENKSIPADGLSASYLNKLNEKYKLSMKVYKASNEELRTLFYKTTHPFIIYWNNSHFVVVEKIKDKKWTIIDPAFGRIKYTFEEICARYSGYLIFLYKKPDYEKIKEENPFLGLFKDTLRNRYTVRFLLSMIIGQFCIMAFAVSIRNIISEEYAWIISLLILFLIILIQIFSVYLKVSSLKKYNVAFENIITKRIFKGVLNQNMDFLEIIHQDPYLKK